MKFLLPLILLILGTAAGGGAAFFLVSEDEMVEQNELDTACLENTHLDMDDATAPLQAVPLEEREYARMNNQFVVPVVLNERVASLMVMSLSLEVAIGGQEAVFSHEPRLRDAFLQVMFNHANMGGFNGAFTSSSNMRLLREALQKAADDIMSGHISDVLIVEIVRQDVIN